MVDIVSRRCREPTCGRRPLYNMDGLRPVCCSQHKLPGMIDVVSTRCQEPVRVRFAGYIEWGLLKVMKFLSFAAAVASVARNSVVVLCVLTPC